MRLLRLFALSLVSMAMVAGPAWADMPDLAVKQALLAERRAAFAARDPGGRLDRACREPAAGAAAARCFDLLLGWGNAAVAVEQNRDAYPYFYRAMQIAYRDPALRGSIGRAWIAWRVAAAYADRAQPDTQRERQLASVKGSELDLEAADARIALAVRLYQGRLSPEIGVGRYRREIDYDPLLARVAGRDDLAQDAHADNARALAAQGRQRDAIARLEAVDPWCATRDYAAETCLSAAISGAMLAFLLDQPRSAQRWRDRLQRALTATDRTDRLTVFGWSAMGASEAVLGNRASATAYFEAAINFAEMLGQDMPQQIDDAVATFAVMLAESGYYQRALGMAARIADDEQRKLPKLHYARALALFRLGRIDEAGAVFADDRCDTLWTYRHCLLKMRIGIANLMPLQTEQGEPLMRYLGSLASPEQAGTVRMSWPTRRAMDEHLGMLTTFWRATQADAGRFDVPPATRIEQLYLAASFALIYGRPDEAATLAQRSLAQAQASGLDADSVTIENQELLARLNAILGCGPAAYRHARRAADLSLARQAGYRDFDSGARNDLSRFTHSFRTFARVSFAIAHPAPSGEPARCG